MMEIITRQLLANTAKERWRQSYYNEPAQTWGSLLESSSEKVYEGLTKLGENPNPDDVDRVIGNTSWTEVPRCDECKEHKGVVIMLGEEPDYESNTANICEDCINKANSFLTEFYKIT